LNATLPAKIAGATNSADTTTSSGVFDALGSLPRLNLRRSREMGKRDMTVNHTRENISEITIKLAPAVAYNIPLNATNDRTEIYGEPVWGTSWRNTLGITLWRASCSRSSQALRIPSR
jgi:hypothetical protein